MLKTHKKWLLIINGISFVIASIDGFVWRATPSGGFPVFTILGIMVASIICGIYGLVYIIRNCKGSDIVVKLISLWVLAPLSGTVGAFAGMMAGLMLF